MARMQAVRCGVAAAAVACATVLVGAGGASAGERNARIQFWSGRNGRPAVWEMRPDGSGKRLLTRFPENARGIVA